LAKKKEENKNPILKKNINSFLKSRLGVEGLELEVVGLRSAGEWTLKLRRTLEGIKQSDFNDVEFFN